MRKRRLKVAWTGFRWRCAGSWSDVVVIECGSMEVTAAYAASEHALMFVLSREGLVIGCDISTGFVSSFKVEIVLHLLAPRDICPFVWREGCIQSLHCIG